MERPGLPGADRDKMEHLDYQEQTDKIGAPGLPGADGQEDKMEHLDYQELTGQDGAPGLPGADGQDWSTWTTRS